MSREIYATQIALRNVSFLHFLENHHSACSSLSFQYALLQIVRQCKNEKENLSFAFNFVEEMHPCAGSTFHVQITTAGTSKHFK